MKQIALTTGLLFCLLVQPAFADKGDEAERVWMSGQDVEAIKNALKDGNEICIGSPRQHTCMLFNPLSNEVRFQEVSRPKGLNKNTTAVRTLMVTADIVFQVDAGTGSYPTSVQHIVENQNSAAVWNQGFAQVPAAAMNGAVAAGIQATTNPCRDGRCGNGSTILNVVEGATAVAGASSEANSDSAVEIQAGCLPAACGLMKD